MQRKKMEIDRKLIVEQEQLDIDDEMAEDVEDEPDDNIWLGRLGALLTPCRPTYHSTGQPLYPNMSAESIKAQVLARLAQELKAQNEILHQARELNKLATVNNSTESSVHFENADVTITKIQRSHSSISENKFKADINGGNFVGHISNGNTKLVNVNSMRFVLLFILTPYNDVVNSEYILDPYYVRLKICILYDRSHVKSQSGKSAATKKRASGNNSVQVKSLPFRGSSTSPSHQSSSPVIKKLKEDLKLAKSAIRTCPICSKGTQHARITYFRYYEFDIFSTNIYYLSVSFYSRLPRSQWTCPDSARC